MRKGHMKDWTSGVEYQMAIWHEGFNSWGSAQGWRWTTLREAKSYLRQSRRKCPRHFFRLIKITHRKLND